MTILAGRLGVDAGGFRYSTDIRPGSAISIITGAVDSRQLLTATWWLYLQQTDQGLKPHKDYFSVNTNYKKLPKKTEYKKSRCIIPATAFVESQDGKHPHLLEPADNSAIAFGGLYKTWTDKISGEVRYSASIITLPGHPALENIHRKSVPLWLPESYYETWLDSEVTDTTTFDDLLNPSLQTDLQATPINRASNKKPIAESFLIKSVQ